MNGTAAIPYNTLTDYLRERFGERVQKIPLDAGFTCPNRDGTLSHDGCAFCNAEGSGTGLKEQGLSLTQQWDYWFDKLRTTSKAKIFMAYLQSYTNTYGPLERLRRVLGELEDLHGLAGLSLGTRPDCLDDDKLDLIGGFPAKEIHLEIGLQSSNDDTLLRINRGHTAADFAAATEQAHARGIKVVAHLMAGLPGETEEDFLASVDFISKLPVHGVKLHNLYICQGSPLETQYRRGEYAPLKLDTYARMVSTAITRLRGDIIVHRINGDPTGDELVAPLWAAKKQDVIRAIQNRMRTRKMRQAQHFSSFE